MAALPVEVLFGVYLGLLTGIVPALVAGSLGFVFRYVTGVTVPGFAVVGLGVALAGVNGGLLALLDPAVVSSGVRALVALTVVLMMTLYAHNRGDQLGATLPRRLTLARLRDRTLSADIVERVGGFGEVRVRVAGDVSDVEGYPPLPADLRAEIRDGEWAFPADLPVSELEARLADRLRTDHDLSEVSVSIDRSGRAAVSAAPPVAGLSRRVPAGERAVAVDALVPSGIAAGDEVSVETPTATVSGTVVSAPPASGTGASGADDAVDDENDPPATDADDEARVGVAVDRADAPALLDAPTATVVVSSRGVYREFDLVSLLRQAGDQFRRIAVGAGGPLDGRTLDDASVRDAYGVAVLAVRRSGGWAIAPGETTVEAGDELIAVGGRAALDGFAEAVA